MLQLLLLLLLVLLVLLLLLLLLAAVAAITSTALVIPLRCYCGCVLTFEDAANTAASCCSRKKHLPLLPSLLPLLLLQSGAMRISLWL